MPLLIRELKTGTPSTFCGFGIPLGKSAPLYRLINWSCCNELLSFVLTKSGAASSVTLQLPLTLVCATSGETCSDANFAFYSSDCPFSESSSISYALAGL